VVTEICTRQYFLEDGYVRKKIKDKHEQTLLCLRSSKDKWP
jgi:hypothetical protein